jgi:CRISPR/Cas system CSM-associated protein Csm3 (group 7 of RAMP superfamily)
MNTRLTLFSATLVQDSALSVSGIDRESVADRSFALVDGVPTLAGGGLKGAAVAMARRFFEPLPRSVSEDQGRESGFRRSAWEFTNAAPQEPNVVLALRAGVGIRQKTGARAGGVLYDREVVPAGTRWDLDCRVDWSHAGDEGAVAEGILGYVLMQHWSPGRCWLGGDVARGLGWCHLEGVRAWRLDGDEYDRWVQSGRKDLPSPLRSVPVAKPTRSWCFRTLDLKLTFGEYRPMADEPAWGLDMFAIGPHDVERAIQATGDGIWARPSWAAMSDPTPDALATDRALLTKAGRPLLPGSSLRGPLRHAFSRAKTAAGQPVQDPHPVQGNVDPGGQIFSTVAKSSRVLIRDGRAEEGWAAARLHMHAEDEFSAGSYGSAKRDAVRVLRGAFPMRIVVEGPDASTVDQLVAEIESLVALGALGHLPVGGHKTRGAGWGRWHAASWIADDVSGARRWTPPDEATPRFPPAHESDRTDNPAVSRSEGNGREEAHVRMTTGAVASLTPTLAETAALARTALGEHRLVAWWCDPAIDLAHVKPPAVFGHQWPDEAVRIDEVAFYADRVVWRAAGTAAGTRWVFIEEVAANEPNARAATVAHVPARLHNSNRFAAAKTGQGQMLLREWHVDGQLLGFTLIPEEA